MEWIDDGIILATRPYGERSHIVSLLTRSHGRHTGLAHGATARSRRGLFLPGNVVHARWRARLADQLGALTCELLHPHAAALLVDKDRLACLAAACAMAEACLPEREPQGIVHAALEALLAGLVETRAGWAEAYVLWELVLLRELGYGLDLAHCAATGRNDQLAWVSPRTGRAVSLSAGEPYRDRLLALPPFLASPKTTPAPGSVPAGEIAAGLRLTGYFLERHVMPIMPPARTRLADRFAGGSGP